MSPGKAAINHMQRPKEVHNIGDSRISEHTTSSHGRDFVAQVEGVASENLALFCVLAYIVKGGGKDPIYTELTTQSDDRKAGVFPIVV